MYENYLLNPHAIASIVSQLQDFRTTPITPEEIEEWLDHHRLDTKYYPTTTASELEGDKWKQQVDGAKLLNSLFNEFSECRYSYDKKVHGLTLTDWISDNTPDDLAEVAEVIKAHIWPTGS
jgi:hypothetical protein